MNQYGLTYLATPYSRYPAGLAAAFEDAAALTARLLQKGCQVYSPIVHTHPIAIYGAIDPYAHDIWLPFDETMMRAARTLFVAMMPTWQLSKGIKHEIDFFEDAGKPIHYLDVVDLNLSAHPVIYGERT